MVPQRSLFGSVCLKVLLMRDDVHLHILTWSSFHCVRLDTYEMASANCIYCTKYSHSKVSLAPIPQAQTPRYRFSLSQATEAI